MPDFTKDNIAPDCRLSAVFTPKQSYFGVMGWMEPVFCASCHKRGPDVPTENMTFACWLCQDCFEKYGEVLGAMVMPDQVFWEKVKQESIEKYGRELTHNELEIIVASDSSPLATLLKTGR